MRAVSPPPRAEERPPGASRSTHHAPTAIRGSLERPSRLAPLAPQDEGERCGTGEGANPQTSPRTPHPALARPAAFMAVPIFWSPSFMKAAKACGSAHLVPKPRLPMKSVNSFDS